MAAGPVKLPNGVTNYAQLMAMPPDKLDQLLGLRPRYDIPPGSARALRMVGMIDQSEVACPPRWAARVPICCAPP
jgi:hypothetical protein